MKQLRAEGIQTLALVLKEDCVHLERLSRDDQIIVRRAEQAACELSWIAERCKSYIDQGEEEEAA